MDTSPVRAPLLIPIFACIGPLPGEQADLRDIFCMKGIVPFHQRISGDP